MYVLPLPPSIQLIACSEIAYVKVVDDVMGPAMFNIDSLLKISYGCGALSMMMFAPTQYLSIEMFTSNKPRSNKCKSKSYLLFEINSLFGVPQKNSVL